MSRSREVFHSDAIEWLAANTLGPRASIITSLPDSSEMSSLSFDGWRAWFIETSTMVCNAVADEQVAIFYQTDVKRDGTWVDKGHLVHSGADRAGAALLWHKVVCRAPAGTTTFGRPAYAHLMCFSKKVRLLPGESTADVLPRLGEMTWARAMGLEACVAACAFVRDRVKADTVVDPFCGVGTALAVANQMGLNAIGVELSKKRAEKARGLSVRLEAPI